MPNWLQFVKKLNNSSIEEFALDFCKNTMGKKNFLGKRTVGIFERSDISDLPTIFTSRIKGLKNPKVKIKNNCSQNYNCFAFSISESGKPVEQFAMSLDTATGEPILNVSRRAFQNEELAFSGRYIADTSKTVARNSKPTFSMAQDNVSLSISDADYAHWLDIKCNKQLCKQLTERSGITIPNEKQILKLHKNAQSPKKVNEEMNKIREATQLTVIPKYRPVIEMTVTEINSEMAKLTKQITKLEKEIYEKAKGKAIKEFNSTHLQKLPKDALYNPETGKSLVDKKFIKSNSYANKYSKLIELKSRVHELDTQKLKLNPPKVNKKMLQATLTQYNLDLLPAQHPQINIIKKLEKLPLEESIKESRALFAKEIGITEELIKIEKRTLLEETFDTFGVNIPAYFDPLSTTIRYSSKLNSSDIPHILRHEMDHLEKYAKIGKTIGMKHFKELICKGDPKMEQLFDEQAWEQIFKNVNIEDFNAKPYIEALKAYTPINGPKSFSYFGNLLEQSAYKIATSINTNNAELYTHSRLSEIILKKTNELKSIVGKDFNTESYIKKYNYVIPEKALASQAGYIIKTDTKIIAEIEHDIEFAKCNKEALRSSYLNQFLIN